jgi:ATP-dependent Lon protease
VILPARNKRDLEDIPQSAKALLEFVWVEHVSEALEVALGPGAAGDKAAGKVQKEREMSAA